MPNTDVTNSKKENTFSGLYSFLFCWTELCSPKILVCRVSMPHPPPALRPPAFEAAM